MSRFAHLRASCDLGNSVAGMDLQLHRESHLGRKRKDRGGLDFPN